MVVREAPRITRKNESMSSTKKKEDGGRDSSVRERNVSQSSA